MNPPTRILAATDLSAPARHAAERAALTCQALGADLDLLHVADLGPLDRLRQLMNAEPADLETRVLGAAQQKLHQRVHAVLHREALLAPQQAVLDVARVLHQHASADEREVRGLISITVASRSPRIARTLANCGWPRASATATSAIEH